MQKKTLQNEDRQKEAEGSELQIQYILQLRYGISSSKQAHRQDCYF